MLIDLLFVLNKYKLNNNVLSSTDVTHLKRITIFFIVMIFSILALVLRNAQQIFKEQLALGIIYIILSVLIFSCSLYFIIKFKVFNFKFSKAAVLKNLPLIIMAVLVVLLSIDCFYSYPKYDSFEFFNLWIRKINLETFNNLGYLKLSNHISVLYAIIVYLIYAIIGNLYYATILFNIICNILTIFAVYKLFSYLFKETKIFPYICAAIFAFSPFTLGVNGYVYLDTAMMYGVLFFVCCYITKQDYDILFLSALLAIFSKEVGFLVVGVIVFIPFFIKLFKLSKKQINKSAFENTNWIYYACMFIVHLAFVVFFLIKSWATNGGWVEYGLNPKHFANVITSILFTNFTWIFVLFIAIALIKMLCLKHKKQFNFKQAYANNYYLTPILTALGLSMLFNTFVETWEHIRYLTIQISMIYILGLIAIYYLIKNVKVNSLVLIGITLLLLVQSFVTIDPTMLAFKNKIYLGSGELYLLRTGYRTEEPTGYMNDNCCYNKQMNMFDITFDMILKQINYDTNKCLISGDFSNNGDFINHMAWDNGKNRRYITDNLAESIQYFTITNDTDLTQFFDFDEVYYVDLNCLNHVDENKNHNKPVEYYLNGHEDIKIDSQFDVEFFGWRFTISKLVKNRKNSG